jgi:hypothetical protein
MFEWIKWTNIKYCWLATFLVTAIVGFGFTPWAAIRAALANGGVGDEGAALIAVAAAFTFPATLGFALLFTVIDRGWLPINTPGRVAVVTGIFIATAALSEFLGLRLLESPRSSPPTTGNAMMRVPQLVFDSYLFTFGWALLFTALVIGLATAATISVWVRENITRPSTRESR